MAVLKSKQLNPNLTGSYILSGSSQTLHGTTTIHGTTIVSGSLTLKGTSVDLNIRQDDNTNIARLLTTTGGTSGLKLYDNLNHGSALETININSSDQNALIISSGSSTIFTIDRDSAIISGSSTSTGSFGKIFESGNRLSTFLGADGTETMFSGSSTSTGSFGTLETSGVINATGRIFENGTSVIDHATAMAIVFGG